MEDENTQERMVPVIEEELVTGAHAVKTGSVRVHKEVEHFRKNVEMPAMRDVVSVNRVPVNQVVTSAPEVREEGDTLIVPVLEEEIVVEKRLVLKEEIHIRRRRIEDRVTRSVELDREHATIERLDSEGNVVATSSPTRSDLPQSGLFSKHKNILK
ncbi:MAG: hypothetical protein QOJ99_2414 [Bryobacterales bacterium]|jgi:uncharacterized protein (TIGR02271 family)|nr:hypothetical protein [Bryobacterales bacterium]